MKIIKYSFADFVMSKVFWTEFLELYRDNRCLWDTQCTSYAKKDVKKAAYQMLLYKMRQFDEYATLDAVKKKIDTFRAGYRREEKKVKESQKAGSPRQQQYKPTLWYFDLLSFLDTIEDSYKPEQTSFENTQNVAAAPPSYTESQNTKVLFKKSKKRNKDLADVATNYTSDDEDDCAVFCKNLKLQMRDLETEQNYICQKLISDAIFLARTCQLNLTSCIQTQAKQSVVVSPSLTPSPSHAVAFKGFSSPPDPVPSSSRAFVNYRVLNESPSSQTDCHYVFTHSTPCTRLPSSPHNYDPVTILSGNEDESANDMSDYKVNIKIEEDFSLSS